MKYILSLFVILGFLVTAQNLPASEGHEHLANTRDSAANNSKDAIQPDHTDTAEVGNKICPVSGEKVGEMGQVVRYEYNGKIYNLCCKMCVKDFKKNPAKYSKIADEEVAKEKETQEKNKEGKSIEK